jgi:hypothetical protein
MYNKQTISINKIIIIIITNTIVNLHFVNHVIGLLLF